MTALITIAGVLLVLWAVWWVLDYALARTTLNYVLIELIRALVLALATGSTLIIIAWASGMLVPLPLHGP